MLREHLQGTREYLAKKGTRPDFEITSLPYFNEKAFGLNRKELTIIGARPSNGKSALALQIADDISQTHKVLFISLEMFIEKCVIRLFCNNMRVNNTKLKYDGIAAYSNQYDKFIELKQKPRLAITESVGKNWEDIEQMLIELAEKPDVIILDYIQCISKIGLKKLEVVDEYVKNLRAMAGQFDFAAVILSQINRANVQEGNEPTMMGLKSSGFLEEHADNVWLLHFPYHYDCTQDKTKFKITIAKSRDGETGSVMCQFIPWEYRFEDAVRDVEAPTENHQKVADMFKGKTVKTWQDKEE